VGRPIDALQHRFGGRRAAGVLQVFEEIYVPTRYEAMREFEAQAEVPAPAPAPGDPDRETFRGIIRIDAS
jgi:hypothetical protein